MGETSQSLTFPRVKYIVDKFHARGHVDQWCLEHCHLGAAAKKELVDAVNTSICEITFSWLARFKSVTRK